VSIQSRVMNKDGHENKVELATRLLRKCFHFGQLPKIVLKICQKLKRHITSDSSTSYIMETRRFF